MHITFRCDPALIDRLERPVPAAQTLPDWLRNMPASAYSDVHCTDVRTVKQCPPFIDAMCHGFIMPLPCDILVQDGKLSWDWDLPPLSVEAHPRSPISFHVPAQVTGTPFHQNDQAIVKFNSFWTIELEPGYALFAAHPANREDLPFRLLSGMVDSDRFTDVGILFPAVWTNPGFEGILPRGTPVAQCFPVERAALDLHYAAFTPVGQQGYEETAKNLLSTPGVYRKTFRVKRPRSSTEDSIGETETQLPEVQP